MSSNPGLIANPATTATATATLSGGAVGSITLTGGGNGYAFTPSGHDRGRWRQRRGGDRHDEQQRCDHRDHHHQFRLGLHRGPDRHDRPAPRHRSRRGDDQRRFGHRAHAHRGGPHDHRHQWRRGLLEHESADGHHRAAGQRYHGDGDRRRERERRGHRINITNPGSGYSSASPPTITIAAPSGGTAATATATFSTGGAGYLSPPVVTLSGGGGQRSRDGDRRVDQWRGHRHQHHRRLGLHLGPDRSRSPRRSTPRPPRRCSAARARWASITVTYGGNGYSSAIPPVVTLNGGGFTSSRDGDRRGGQWRGHRDQRHRRGGLHVGAVGHDRQPRQGGGVVGQLRQPRHHGHAHLHPGALRLRHGDDHRHRDEQRRQPGGQNTTTRRSW